MSTSQNLFPSIIHDGNYSPDSFGNEVDEICNEIREATRGFGTDEKRLCKTLANSTLETRCKIPARYYQMFGDTLVDVVRKECGNRAMGRALQYLAVDPLQAECEMIEDALQGFGSNDVFLFSIICGRSNEEVALLKKKYQDLNDRDLVRHLCRETSGNAERLVKAVLAESEEEYNRSVHTEEKMEEDADRLRAMGEGRWGTNEDGIFQLLAQSPPKYVQGLNSKYEEKYGNDLATAIKNEMGGELEKGALTLLELKLNTAEGAAKMIQQAVRGLGTNELMLTTLLIRYQGIMGDVAEAYERIANKSLKSVIERETSGQFENLLVELGNNI